MLSIKLYVIIEKCYFLCAITIRCFYDEMLKSLLCNLLIFNAFTNMQHGLQYMFDIVLHYCANVKNVAWYKSQTL